MHRICAIVLLGIMAFWLDAPAFTSTLQAQVPLCCRIKGQHKCAMQSSAPSEPIITAKCPFAPAFGFHAVTVSAPMPGAMRYSVGPLTTQAPVEAQTEALFRISFARSRQKRGPPVTLLG